MILGFYFPGNECNHEGKWPDLKRKTVCGECKVRVKNMRKYRTCTSYCSTISRKCTGAWEVQGQECDEKNTKDCQHDFGDHTSDAICECKDRENFSGEKK